MLQCNLLPAMNKLGQTSSVSSRLRVGEGVVIKSGHFSKNPLLFIELDVSFFSFINNSSINIIWGNR